VRFAVSLLNYRPGRVGGVETYLRSLLPALPAAAGPDEVVVVAHPEAADAVRTAGLEVVALERSDAALVAARIAEAFTPWRDRAAERLFQRLAPDAILFPQQSIFPKRVAAPAVVTAVDVQHLVHPERFGAFDRSFRACLYPYSLRRAARVIAISECTRRSLIALARVPAGKVVAVPFGFTPSRESVTPTDAVDGPYLYYPAATFPHKNHRLLLRTCAELWRRGALEHRLVLTGERTREWRALQRLVRELGIQDRVLHLGYLPGAEVRRVYAGAAAVLFPTTFEGFGLPVLEAVEAGKKVITSRLDVFDEIGVPRAWQIDFADPGQLLAALQRPGVTVLDKPPSTWEENALATVRELRRAARGE
jgi:glycosyltransferase involved in cell wall biosynthesis